MPEERSEVQSVWFYAQKRNKTHNAFLIEQTLVLLLLSDDTYFPSAKFLTAPSWARRQPPSNERASSSGGSSKSHCQNMRKHFSYSTYQPTDPTQHVQFIHTEANRLGNKGESAPGGQKLFPKSRHFGTNCVKRSTANKKKLSYLMYFRCSRKFRSNSFVHATTTRRQEDTRNKEQQLAKSLQEFRCCLATPSHVWPKLT